MADDDDDNISELPLGYIYHLTDSDVITILNLKLQNIPLEFNMVINRDLYSNNPSTLLKNVKPVLKLTQEYVIYTPRYRVKGSTEIGRRVLGGKVGIWKQVSNYQYRCDDVGNAIGKVVSFVFFEGGVDVGVLRKTDWCMTEFTTMNENEGGFAICKVREEAARSLDDTSSDDKEEEENEDESEDDDSDEE
ncbi:NAC transcription factor 25 [Tanacetum coccineum]